MQRNVTTAELVERTRQGAEGAFDELVRRHQALVFGAAFHVLNDPDDARDVVQETFIRAFARIGQLRDPQTFSSWLRTIAIHEARAFRSRKPEWISLGREIRVEGHEATVYNRLNAQLALDCLDPKCRETVLLYYMQSHSLKEIGEFLGEPVSTIKSRLRNSRMKLRKHFELEWETVIKQMKPTDEILARIGRIIKAVTDGDETTLRGLLAEDPLAVEAREESSGHTALHIAATAGQSALVELLLSHGADPNALEKGDNAGPLHFAAERGRLETVKLLVEAGADVNWTYDLHERGPLGWACVFGKVQADVAEYLIEQGAKIDLFSAIALGRADIVRELIESDPNTLRLRMSRFENYRTPLEFAAEHGRHDLARLLIDAGIDIGFCDAAALDLQEELQKRLARQSSLTILNWGLRSAVMGSALGTARLLLETGADPNYAPQTVSLLFEPIGKGNAPLARLLIEFGADLEYRDSQWNSTPLGWQVFFANVESTMLALELGAKVDSHLAELAESGERGELRRWSDGTQERYRAVKQLLLSRTSG